MSSTDIRFPGGEINSAALDAVNSAVLHREAADNPMLAAARAYASRGIAVFPLRPGKKIPLPGSNGVKDATTDLDQIDRWWTTHPEANIGACPESAGMCVIDVDEGGTYEAEPNTPATKTPHGRHFWYGGSLPPTASKVAPNIDTRGRASYVLVSPSVVNGVAYEGDVPDAWDCPDVPEWIVEKCEAKAEPRKAPPAVTADLPWAIEQARQRVLAKPAPVEGAGSDEACYKAIAYMRDLGLSGETIFSMMAEWTGFDDDFLQAKIENANTYAQNEAGADAPTDWQAVADRLGIGPGQIGTEPQQIEPRGEMDVLKTHNDASDILGRYYRDPAVARLGRDRQLRIELPQRLLSGDELDDWLRQRPAITLAATDTVYYSNDPAEADWPAIEAEMARIAGVDQKIALRGKKLDKFAPQEPREPADMPEKDFFDDDKMLINLPEGSVGIVVGWRGDHKTNTVLSMLAKSKAQRILYAAGEGAWGVEKDRLYGPRPELRGRIKVVPRVPLFANGEQVQDFIDGANATGFRPEIVVIDTLATAIAGEDENSSQAAAHLTDNGAAGRIRRAWGCMVLIVAHTGKDAAKGVRGTSGFESNVDFVLTVTADKEHAAIKVLAGRMKGAYEGFSTYYGYIDDRDTVPVPVRITEREYMQRVKPNAAADASASFGMRVLSYLRRNGHHDPRQTGIEPAILVTALTEEQHGPRPGELGEPGVAEWDDARDKIRCALKASKARAWAKGCFEKFRQPGAEIQIERWFSMPPGDDEIEF